MKTFISLLITAFLYMFTMPAQCQFNIGKKIQDKVINRTNKGIDQSIEKGINGILKKKTKSQNDSVQETNSSDEQAESGTQDQTSLQSYSKFDFVPGSKVIFFEDFSQDAVGDFPALWNTNGSGEVMTNYFYPGKWLKITGGSTCIWNDVPLVLTDNFTVEFDVIPQKSENGSTGYYFGMIRSEHPKDFDTGSVPGKSGFFVNFAYNIYFNSYFSYERQQVNGSREGLTQKADQKYHISLWVQKERIRVYQNEVKLFDLPKAIDVNVKYNKMRFEDGTPMISNIRIAVGAPDMRSKLITEGKLVSYGIYFDVNKDVVKPESYGTLKSIADVQKENPDVRVKIVGHTDSDGADATNLDLSKSQSK
jgi:outer membrane protein OmpA-like peptidoglycan-associated protein